MLLLVSYNANLEQAINKEMIIAEILQALAGSMGMLLTLPLTSAVCAAMYYKNSPKRGDGNADRKSTRLNSSHAT